MCFGLAVAFQLKSWILINKPRNLSSAMKIIVHTLCGRPISLECESTDTIAHLKTKVDAIRGIPPHKQRFVRDRKQLGNHFSENMVLADVGVQEGSVLYLVLILETGLTIKIEKLIKSWRSPENGYLYYADAFKSGWREEHGKVLLNLLLKLCQDGAISEGNITEDTWLCIQNGLTNSTKCCFEIHFLEERLRDYKQLYTLLSETSSPIFVWDCGNKTIHIKSNLWSKYHPEILLLCDAHIPYFDTLEGVCLLLDTRRSSEQQVSETSTNINNEKLVHQHRFANEATNLEREDCSTSDVTNQESVYSFRRLRRSRNHASGVIRRRKRWRGRVENLILVQVGMQLLTRFP